MTIEEYNNYVRFLKENGVWGTFQQEWTKYAAENLDGNDRKKFYPFNDCLTYMPYTYMWYGDTSFPWWDSNRYDKEFRKKWFDICKKYMKLFEEESKHYPSRDFDNYKAITRRVYQEALEII